MPIKVNVGLSRKVGQANFGSRGALINLELTIDSNVLAEPDKFQEQIREAFDLIRQSIDEELASTKTKPASVADEKKPTSPASGGNHNHSQTSSRSQPPANQGSGGQRLATPPQVKAIFAIARRQGLEVQELVQERYGLARPDDLTLRQASQFIDWLKGMEQQESA